ncbi:nucleotidyltransferase domain-containing protein [Microbacterium sp. EST19A]|uniref:nucleotidyltransferase domain-containing protein n=1 Tax=Microbacterium sp. EST19A TaxID=2862681 RepID=UPI001CBEE39D|nr:nucleotidyltransferase domain-containing protein [Microbacterium sp. EST19A]
MEVTSVSDARAGLSRIIATFRDGSVAPVIIGSHRRPEAALLPFDRYRALTKASPTVIGLDRLRSLRPLIERLAAASHLEDVQVYGSVARGEQTELSDVDLLVTPRAEATMFDIAQFEIDMEMLLGVPVSVVSAAALNPEHDAAILHDAVRL